jgi:phosphatidylserine/phosphatidylglycerophosphate/cardiolipin synthase-like enzyme
VRFDKRQVVATRFVRACPKGHVDDLDWSNFVHGRADNCRRQLWLDERGTTGDLADLVVRCECGKLRGLYEATLVELNPLGTCRGARPLVRRFADRFWGSDWPGSSRPSVYYDPRSLEADGPGGILHAKAVVIDEEAVFVTSANLTEAALDRNFELGLLVRDKALAASVISRFQILIDRNLLRSLPA